MEVKFRLALNWQNYTTGSAPAPYVHQIALDTKIQTKQDNIECNSIFEWEVTMCFHSPWGEAEPRSAHWNV